MRKYSDDFKREAVRKIHGGQTVASLSRELGVSEGVLHNWKKKDYEGAMNQGRTTRKWRV